MKNAFYSAEVLYVLIAVIGLSVGSWYLTPKGDNQTYVNLNYEFV